MTDEYTHMRVLESTKNKIKAAAALNNETMLALLDMLANGVLDGTIKVSTLPRPADSSHIVPTFDVYKQKRDAA